MSSVRSGTTPPRILAASSWLLIQPMTITQVLPIAADCSLIFTTVLQTKTAKIPAGVPSGTATANKTGELADSGKLGVVENDIAIVFDKEHPYVLCVLSNNIKNNSSAQNTIKKISADVYTYMTTKQK